MSERTVEEIGADPQVGDIYAASWGYDQTNVNFFKVVKRNKSSVLLREIEATVVGGKVFADPDTDKLQTVWLTDAEGNMIPNEDGGFLFAKQSFEKLCMARNGDFSRLKWDANLSSSARPWNGTGMYDTIAAGYEGH